MIGGGPSEVNLRQRGCELNLLKCHRNPRRNRQGDC
jgi:hypothetical protein